MLVLQVFDRLIMDIVAISQVVVGEPPLQLLDLVLRCGVSLDEIPILLLEIPNLLLDVEAIILETTG